MLGEGLRKAKKLLRLLPEPRYRHALRDGVAAAVEHETVLRSRTFPMIIDVGANVGQFALAARVCCPQAVVVAFEPLAGPAETFSRVFRGDPKVQLHQVAIGPESRTAEMHVSARVDSSSLLPITERQEHMFPGTAERSRETVRISPLPEVLRDVPAGSLLKIDVQGFELSVLQGCADLLDRFSCVYVECSFVELYERQALADEVAGFLRARGLALDGIFNVVYDRGGRCIQGDFLFVRRSGTR